MGLIKTYTMKQSIQYGVVWLLGIALMSPLFGWSQGLVTGTVSDENGMPLPGATVMVEETNAGTTTDFDGNYQISADVGQTLAFGYVGYEWQKEIVDGIATINVQLSPANELDEVVLTGVAGKTDLKKVSFAVGKVNEDKIQQAPGVNPANAIRSKVPGVTVVQGSGLPGNASAIRIRGATSLVGSQAPLYTTGGE